MLSYIFVHIPNARLNFFFLGLEFVLWVQPIENFEHRTLFCLITYCRLNLVVHGCDSASKWFFASFPKSTFGIGRLGLTTVGTGRTHWCLALCPRFRAWKDWGVGLSRSVATTSFCSNRADYHHEQVNLSRIRRDTFNSFHTYSSQSFPSINFGFKPELYGALCKLE